MQLSCLLIFTLVYLSSIYSKNLDYYYGSKGYDSQPQPYRTQSQSFLQVPSYGFRGSGNGGKKSGFKGTISDCLAGKLRCNFKVMKVKSSGDYQYEETTTTDEPSTYSSPSTVTFYSTTTLEASTSTDAYYYYRESKKGGYSKDGYNKGDYISKGENKNKSGNSTETTKAIIITTATDVDSDDDDLNDLKKWLLKKNIKGGKGKNKKRRKNKKNHKGKKSRWHKKSRKYSSSDSTTLSVSASTDTTTSPITSTTEDKKDCSYWDMKLGKCKRHYEKSSSHHRKPKIIRKKVLLNIIKSCYGGKRGCYGSPWSKIGGFKNYKEASHAATTSFYATPYYATHNSDIDYFANSPASYYFANSPANYYFANSPASYYFANSPANYYFANSPASYYFANSPASYYFANSPASYYFANSPASYYFANSPASYYFANSSASYYFANSSASYYFANSPPNYYFALWIEYPSTYAN
ncbi:unnamed protein product [Gordionus sp. m RMFG-2023]